MGIIQEFKTFSLRGNVIDLAVGVVIGTAFGKIVSSLVSDIIMPMINPLIPGGNWKEAVIGSDIKIGSFMGTVVDFLIISFVIFLVIKGINILQRKEDEKTQPPPPPGKEEILLTEIRDLLKEKQR